MKPVLLPACFAAITAAADLKDPAEVARQWDRTIEQHRQPVAQVHHLSARSDLLLPVGPERTFRPESVAPPVATPPRLLGPLYDAPSRPLPRYQPPEGPDSAAPWLDLRSR